MKLSLQPDPPQWPKLLGTAAASSFMTLFIARNFFPAEKKIRHRDHGRLRHWRRRLRPHHGPPARAAVGGGKQDHAAREWRRDISRPCWRESAPRNARSRFENFLWKEGEISDAFAAALAERARAGREGAFSPGRDGIRFRPWPRHPDDETRRGLRGDFSLRAFLADQLPDASQDSRGRWQARIHRRASGLPMAGKATGGPMASGAIRIIR